MSASCAPARALSPPPSWRKMAKYLRFYGTCSVEVLRSFTYLPAFKHAMACSNIHVRTWRIRTHTRNPIRARMRASCAPARALSPSPSWRKMAKYLRFMGLLVLRFCDFLPAILPSNMPCHARTCMFEHTGVYMPNSTGTPMTPMVSSRVLAFFGGLTSAQTLGFIAAPLTYRNLTFYSRPIIL